MKSKVKILFIATATLLSLMVFMVAVPFMVSAQSAQKTQEGTGKFLSGIIPCGNAPAGSTAKQIKDQECDFNDLLALGQNIIKYLVLLSIPIAAIAFAWAGFMYLSSAGDTGKIKKAKEIFWKVMWGFIFILTAWLIVYTATSLLGDGFSFLLK